MHTTYIYIYIHIYTEREREREIMTVMLTIIVSPLNFLIAASRMTLPGPLLALLFTVLELFDPKHVFCLHKRNSVCLVDRDIVQKSEDVLMFVVHW